MFESIAMICYLSITEPQEIERPLFEPKEIAHELFTGGGGEPEGDPKKEKEN